MDLAFSIAIEFSKGYRRKYGRGLYSIKTVRNSRWWTHFEKASAFILKEDIAPFIRYFFEQDLFDETILPHMLVSKRGRTIYKDFSLLKGSSITVDVKNKVNFTLKEIADWSVKKDVKDNKIGNFVKDRSNTMKIERGILYEPIFLFSKEYTKDKEIEDYEIKKMLFRKNHEKVYEVLKKISGDDFRE